jgi:hypothetical protein
VVAIIINLFVVAAGLGEEAVERGEDLRSLRADVAAEGVLAVALALLGVLQHGALPVVLVHPDVWVHEHVPGELEHAHPRHQRHGTDQRVHLRAQNTAQQRRQNKL